MKAKFPQKNLRLDNELSKILFSKTILIDVGADGGDFIFYVKSIVTQGSLYAIEPDLNKFNNLYENCHQWKQGTDNQIYALNIAAGDRDGQADFYHAVSSNEKSIFTSDLSGIQVKSLEAISWEKVTVDIYKLDSLFKSIQPDLIKINAQGDELKILQGSTEILKLGKTKFLITSKQENQDEIEKFMNSFGYQSTVFNEISLFRNPKKDNQYKILTKSLKNIWSQTIPAPWRYQIKKLVKK